jgi:hypothetical protein
VRFRGVLAEHLIKATAGGKKVQRVVKDQERFRQRIDDRQRKGLRLGTIVKFLHLAFAPFG